MAPDIDQPIADLLIEVATYRERFIDGKSRGLLRKLADIEAESRARLAIRIERLSGPDKLRFQRGRDLTTEKLQLLIAEIKRLASEVRQATKESLNESSLELIESEIEFQEEYLAADGLTGEAITAAAILAAANARPAQGRLVRESLVEQERNVRRTVTGSIREGLLLNRAADAITRSIYGRDGSMRRHRGGADMFLRTNLTKVAAETVMKVGARFGVQQWVFSAVLDTRTSDTCRSLSGRIFTMGEGPRPPRHPRCRSLAVPITSKLASARSLDSYGPWLKRQPRSVVYDALGPTKAKLFLDGGLTIDKFTDAKTFRPLTLEQLRERQAAAFRRAGVKAR